MSVEEVVSRGRIRCYGHVLPKYKSDWVSAGWELQIERRKSKGRGRKTSKEGVKVDMNAWF